ncbi:MAG: phage Gp37/Gp68 family protein [Pseudomonadota bacterium]
MGTTAISYVTKSWGLVVGCTKCSPGCRSCWAARLAATRLRHRPEYAGLAERNGDGYNWTGEVRLLPQRLEEPLRWRKPQTVFVCPMGDLFHQDVPEDYIAQVFTTMWVSPQHTYLVLTKRPGRMADLSRRFWWGAKPLPNVWLGVSVEDQRAADERIPLLLQTSAVVRWISAEPLLGNVHLGPENCHVTDPSMVGRTIDWIVAGAESGPGARPCELDWLRSLRDQCQAVGVSYYLKQARIDGKLVHLPELDGRQWTEMPVSQETQP